MTGHRAAVLAAGGDGGDECRALELRNNVTAYDACYVALAEALDATATLLTADARLAAASGVECHVELLRDE